MTNKKAKKLFEKSSGAESKIFEIHPDDIGYEKFKKLLEEVQKQNSKFFI
tara:strand:+ start:286 stop:435 length:150 start_codon:yes stop_codon:yes gene_type:complete